MRLDKRLSQILLFILRAAFWSAVCLVVHLALLDHGVQQIRLLTVASAFTGITTALITLMHTVTRYGAQEIQRKRTIAEMNHHVRNALTVILHYGTRGDHEEERAAVRGAVDRIMWTLDVILPQGWSPVPNSDLTQKTFYEREAKPRRAVAGARAS